MASTHSAHRWRRRFLAAIVAVASLIGLTYVGTALLHVPPPHTLIHLQTTETSQQGIVFPSRPVTSTGPARPFETSTDVTLPATVPWKGHDIPLQQMLDTTNTRAFLVLHGGKLVHEWYSEGVDASTTMSSWSVAKSVVSLLVGQAIGRGDLSEDDRLVDILPELRTGTDYDTVTVGDLLDMASGIDISENYNPWWPFTGTARLLLSTDLPGYVADHRTLSFEPGSKAEYRSVDTLMLTMILAKVDGRPLSTILSEDLWTPMGAEYAANWNLDRPGGIEKGFCGLNATARDFAKIGQLVLDHGKIGNTQVVPSAWINRLSTPSALPLDGWGYSAQWWHPPTSDGDFTAIGVYGQYIYVNPAADTVIVKLSDYGTEQDELDTVDAMRAIAEALTPAPVG